MKTLLGWLAKLFSGQFCCSHRKQSAQSQRDKIVEMSCIVDMDEY